MSESTDLALLLRLEGPLQSWGENSKMVMRRTAVAPTKSGVLGMISCAMGLRRAEAVERPIRRERLRRIAERIIPQEHRRSVLRLLNTLQMGVRVDRPGVPWGDYHTVGAGIGIVKADGKGIKRTGGGKSDPPETLPTRRYYLCDASFLVALQGHPDLVQLVADALQDPHWPVYLGRKCCPPSMPVLVRRKGPDGTEAANPFRAESLKEALKGDPWQPRLKRAERPTDGKLPCLIEWPPSTDGHAARPDAEIWHDTAVSFDPPVHEPRLVIRDTLEIGEGDDKVKESEKPRQFPTPPPPRPQAGYHTKAYQDARAKRLKEDEYLCVFCKAPLEGKNRTMQHITYRHVGTDKEKDDLRSLCRLCHDGVTMIEYGLGMGLDRIDPVEPRWRQTIIQKRDEIIRFRSMETRKRQLQRGLQHEEVE